MTTVNHFLAQKRGLIMGVANEKSIAWGIAKALDKQGAEMIFTYQNDALLKRIEPLTAQLSKKTELIECDVTSSQSIKDCFDLVEKKFGKIDFVVHAIAFSDRNELKGKTIDTTLQNFTNTMHISCYSFLEVCQCAKNVLNDGASIVTLSYLGSQRAVQNYNIMGVAKAALEASVRYAAVDFGADNIRVNAISAGPIKTLAAAGIGDFRKMLHLNEQVAPLKRNVTQEEVGNCAMFLISDLASAITGQTIYVDAGYNIMGMPVENDNNENI